MNTLAKLIASLAALIASLSLAWIAKDGLSIRTGITMGVHGDFPPIQIDNTY
jgi:hypothetical protein